MAELATLGGLIIPVMVVQTGDKHALVNIKNQIRQVINETSKLTAETRRLTQGSSKSTKTMTTSYREFGKEVKRVNSTIATVGSGHKVVTKNVVKDLSMWGGGLHSVNRILNQVRWTMVNLAFGATFLAGLALPFIAATKSAAEWEMALKRIQIVTEGVYDSSEQLGDLSKFLKEARRITPFGRQEAATAFLEYAKAGFTAEEATKALPDIMNLAVAGFTNLDTATGIVAATMHAFAIEGVTTSQVVDTIAKAANESALDVETFGSAMAYVAPVAANLGFRLTETSAALALLSNAGLRGSKAGTAFRQVLNSIANPSEEAKNTMRELGMSFFDAEGNVKDLSRIMLNLNITLEGMTEKAKGDILGQLFNIRSRIAAAAFLNLIEEGGIGIAEMERIVIDAGYAARTNMEAMETATNKWKKSIENVKDAFEPMSSSFLAALTPMIDNVAMLTEKLAELGEESKKARVFGNIAKMLQMGIFSNMPGGLLVKALMIPAQQETTVADVLRSIGGAIEQEQVVVRDATMEYEERVAVMQAQRENFLKTIAQYIIDLEKTLQIPEVKRIVKVIDELREIEALKGINEEERAAIDNTIRSLTEKAETIKELTAEKARLTDVTAELRAELTAERQILSQLNKDLAATTKRISELSSARFTGETRVLGIIRQAELWRKKQELASLGVADAQQFIIDALKLERGEYDSLFEQLSKINAEMVDNTSAFDAWQESIKTAIRAEVEAGQQLQADVTQRIKTWQTALLGIRGMEGGGGETGLDEFINRLQLAYDVHFGGMRNQVTEFLEQQRDREIGVFDTSSQLIEALSTEISKREELTDAVESQTSIVNSKFDELQEETGKLKGVISQITSMRGAVDEIAQGLPLLSVAISDAVSGIREALCRLPIVEEESELGMSIAKGLGKENIFDLINRPYGYEIPKNYLKFPEGRADYGGGGTFIINDAQITVEASDPVSFGEELMSRIGEEIDLRLGASGS